LCQSRRCAAPLCSIHSRKTRRARDRVQHEGNDQQDGSAHLESGSLPATSRALPMATSNLSLPRRFTCIVKLTNSARERSSRILGGHAQLCKQTQWEQKYAQSHKRKRTMAGAPAQAHLGHKTGPWQAHAGANMSAPPRGDVPHSFPTLAIFRRRIFGVHACTHARTRHTHEPVRARGGCGMPSLRVCCQAGLEAHRPVLSADEVFHERKRIRCSDIADRTTEPLVSPQDLARLGVQHGNSLGHQLKRTGYRLRHFALRGAAR
jgi:hypothetical protein